MKNSRKKNNQDADVPIITYPKTVKYPVGNNEEKDKQTKQARLRAYFVLVINGITWRCIDND